MSVLKNKHSYPANEWAPLKPTWPELYRGVVDFATHLVFLQNPEDTPFKLETARELLASAIKIVGYAEVRRTTLIEQKGDFSALEQMIRERIGDLEVEGPELTDEIRKNREAAQAGYDIADALIFATERQIFRTCFCGAYSTSTSICPAGWGFVRTRLRCPKHRAKRIELTAKQKREIAKTQKQMEKVITGGLKGLTDEGKDK